MMKLGSFLVPLVVASAVVAATPDFGMYGFATLDGSTTGGAGGTVVKVSSFSGLKQYAEVLETPYVILVEGEISTNIAVKINTDGAVDASGTISTTYGELIAVGNNKTIVGLGSSAFLNRVGLSIQKKHNIIIRNIKFTMSDVPISKTDENKVVAYRNGAEVVLNDPDCINIQADSAADSWAEKNVQASYNIWIDHCEFYNAATDNKDRYDGLLDAKNNIYNATFSWNYFHDHHKGSLIGNSNGDSLRHEITFHHNYYKNIDARQPMMRYSMSHLYNNYVEGNSGSGNGPNVRKGSNLYIEKNHYASLSQAIFYGDDGKATIVGNKYDGCGALMSSGCGSKTMRIQINSGTTFTTADTSYVKIDSLTAVGSFKPSDYYSYTTDAVTDVKDIVTTWAGIGKISTTEYEQNVVIPSSSSVESSSSITSSSSSSTTAILSETNIETPVHAFFRNGEIVVQAQRGTRLRLFNPLGSLLYVGTATEAETALSLNISQGTYLLQIGKHTQKILIK
jgi:pectate lyase